MSDPQDSRPPGGRPRHAAPPSRAVIFGSAAAGVVLVMLGVVGVVSSNRHDSAKVAVGQESPSSSAPASGAAAAAPEPLASSPAGSPSASVTPSASATQTKKAKTANSGVPAPPAGFSLTFGDGFAGAAGAGLDTGKYRYVTGPGTSFGSGEVETMTDSTQNLFYDGNGHLLIRALHAGTVPATGWTSARFETNAATFGAEKGGVVRVQVAIAQPDLNKQTGAGYWPAVRMIGSDLRTGGVWPQVGEIGIIEDVNGRGSAFGALHCGVNPGGPCNEANGLGSGEHACAGCQNGFHVYAVEIDRSKSPESIRWYVDGVNYFTVAQDRVDPTTWAAAVDHSFFLVFNLSMAGSFPAAYGGGPYPATVSGGTMRIGYVAVYNKR